MFLKEATPPCSCNIIWPLSTVPNAGDVLLNLLLLTASVNSLLPRVNDNIFTPFNQCVTFFSFDTILSVFHSPGECIFGLGFVGASTS